MAAATRAAERRGVTKKARVETVVFELLREHEADGALPTSGRFLFYELEQRGLAAKPSPDDMRPNKRRSIGWPPGEQDVIDALTRLRENGAVPWEWITDDTRHVAEWQHAATVADYLADRLDEATINPWGGEPPLILCESRATAGVLERVASAYCCPISGRSGQVAGHLHTRVAPLLRVERLVLYLGDLDKAGGDIERNTRGVLERAADREIDWERLGITHEQVEERNIEAIWKVDGRDRTGRWAWEAEALTQAGLIALVREKLDALLPERLDDVLEREREEREVLARFLATWEAA